MLFRIHLKEPNIIDLDVSISVSDLSEKKLVLILPGLE